METIIGYRVQNVFGDFLNTYGEAVSAQVEPCTQAEAYRRMSVFFTNNPNATVPTVVPVTRPITPIESASKELGGLLSSLCSRHGLDLGLSSDQIERQIAKELSDLGATGVGILSALPRGR
jgi:hypothetical protein